MNKNKNVDELVTKDFLKQTLDQRLKDLSDRLVKYIDLRLAPIEESVKKIDAMDKKLDSIMKTLDFLSGKYQKFEDEHMILTNQYSQVNDRLNNLEKKSSN